MRCWNMERVGNWVGSGRFGLGWYRNTFINRVETVELLMFYFVCGDRQSDKNK